MGEKVNPAGETGQRSRRHGLECPLDVKQVAQWIVLFLFSAYNGIIVLPSLYLYELSIPVLSVIFLRNCYCNICKVNVQQQTKHCRACNKCIEVFDHHCDWLNNCVGKGNYKYFFAAVTSAAVLCVFVIITSIIFLAALYSDGEKLPVNHPFLNITASTDPSTEPPDSTKLALTVLTAILTILIFIILIFLFQLLALHIKLIKNNKTTYQYIMDKRQKEQAAAKEAELEMNGRTNESFTPVPAAGGVSTTDNQPKPESASRLKSASTVVTVSDIKPDSLAEDSQ